MVRPGACRGDDDLGPVTDKTGRVQGRTVTTSSRGLRGRHSTSDRPSTSISFAAGFHYDTVAPGSRPLHLSHLPHTPVPYDVYGSPHPPSHPPSAVYDPYLHVPTIRPHIPYRSSAQEFLNKFSGLARKLGADFFDHIMGRVPPNSSYSTHCYIATDFGISSSEPFVRRDSRDMGLEGDRGLGEEPDRVRSLYIRGNGDERVHDDDDDDDDDGDDAEEEEKPVPFAPAAPVSSSGIRPHHGKGKGLTGSFMLVMSKISESCNKRPDKARETPTSTQRKKVKSSDWEQIEQAERACSLHMKAVATVKFLRVRVILTASNSGILYLNFKIKVKHYD
ncbi:hypothetical protein M9H77_26424 [Catharanthus roseus]|uniref:Uncharacterized protein n=1 Tax=Catharanthus roseus TaxID=4058 RepID=A0ACC0ADQ2_CATRO|nr:hypothetical protein M9H77_26424 [Catharanthus roseus]